ncbi:MAG: shikimate kinase [Lachnospiraceae bacterium]
MSNIVLIGYMGSGKSSVGRELQRKTGIILLDSDQEIERLHNCKISQIFETKGEEAFREMETEYLRQLCKNEEPLILSTGGGMALREENVILMKKIGSVIYLKAEADTLYRRLSNDTTRPLLQNGDRRQIIADMLAKREPYYLRAADRILQTDGKTLEEVVNEIINYQRTES